MRRAPKLTGNLGAAYTTELAKGSVTLSGNFYYTAKFYFDYVQQVPQSQYATLGLSAAWTDASGRLVLRLSGDNVTDKKYYVGVIQNSFGGAATWAPLATVNGSIRLNLW